MNALRNTGIVKGLTTKLDKRAFPFESEEQAALAAKKWGKFEVIYSSRWGCYLVWLHGKGWLAHGPK